jgi:hypothetical protein
VLNPRAGLLQSERVAGSNGLVGRPLWCLPLSSSTGRFFHGRNYNLMFNFVAAMKVRVMLKKSEKALKNNKLMEKFTQNICCIYNIV